MRLEHFIWKVLIRPLQAMHRKMYKVGRTKILGKIVLLLTTTGRNSGLPRVTPLQFSELGGDFYIASSRGQRADWFRNIQAEPHVQVRVDTRQFEALAEPVTDTQAIADYLQGLIERHPRMGGAMMSLHRLPPRPSRAQLENLASGLAMVIVHPAGNNPSSFSKN